jgi:alpha-D-xyloside xylohydrolase
MPNRPLRLRSSTSLFASLVFLSAGCLATSAAAQLPGDIPPLPKLTIHETKGGFTAQSTAETIEVTVCGDAVIHFLSHAAETSGAVPAQPWMLPAGEACPGAHFAIATTPTEVTLTTAAVKFSLSLKNAAVTYSTLSGDTLLHEGRDIPRTYKPVEINGDKTFEVQDRFSPDATEGFYGLGQHQGGVFNYRGNTVELGQNNTDVAIPFLISTKGYAIMWNTAAFSYADNRFPLEFSFDSKAVSNVDYYLIFGPEMDQIIHQYRTLTGHAPLLPRWAYGLFQSKDRYISTEEIVSVANRYRAEHIPLDAIVQDWFWWKKEGDPVFNANYHDVPADLKKLHDEHIHAMISVWGLFDPTSDNFKDLDAKKFDIPDAHVYDATNPAARDFYWDRLAGKLFAQGWDAFWLDSAEPEEYWPHIGDAILRDKHLSIGNGMSYTNVFPLMHTMGVQDHWKATSQQKRVYLLTRSAFLGQQRVGATTWSGDVYSSYWALQHQVPAGLNFALSGLPYWTTDIGGYHQPDAGKTQFEPGYQDLYARWFEFGTFCPVFRTHGHRDHNELWTYDRVEPTLLKYDKLRYRLMPYIYSLAWRVTNDDYTIQRPLVMDWRTDPKVRDIGDQFMFGPSLLVSPVLEQDATHRRMYLPASPLWYDFWTGATTPGGQHIEVDAPLDKLPLYVRAGSILPLGPEIEYTGQKPDAPIEIRVYRGADGHFALYEDSGDSYDYVKGQHALISMDWNDKAGKLTFGARTGSFPDMVQSRKFKVVFVGLNHGAGPLESKDVDQEVSYSGQSVSVSAH